MRPPERKKLLTVLCLLVQEVVEDRAEQVASDGGQKDGEMIKQTLRSCTMNVGNLAKACHGDHRDAAHVWQPLETLPETHTTTS